MWTPGEVEHMKRSPSFPNRLSFDNNRRSCFVAVKAISEDVGIKMIESIVIKLCESLGINLSTDITGDGTKSHLRPRKKTR